MKLLFLTLFQVQEQYQVKELHKLLVRRKKIVVGNAEKKLF